MYMILALDLDDTLLRRDKTVGERTLAALQRWLAAGHEIIVATGRPPRSIAAALPPELLTAPRIAYNGAHAIVGESVVYRNEISPADVRRIVEWTAANRPHWNVGLEIEDELYLNRASSKPGKYTVTDLTTLCDRPVAKVIFYFPDEREDMTSLVAALPATTRALITPKFSMVQLCGHQTNKAAALGHLLAQRGLGFDALAAIGDDVNDVEMLRQAHIGIAMDNALDEVKAAADWITASAEEDGVADAIDRLLATCAPASVPTSFTTANHHVATQSILESPGAA
jgi:Cof subfamily protein (haloacid dehalogenase superfamily)